MKFFESVLYLEEQFESGEEPTSVCFNTWEVSLTDIVTGKLVEILTCNVHVRQWMNRVRHLIFIKSYIQCVLLRLIHIQLLLFK